MEQVKGVIPSVAEVLQREVEQEPHHREVEQEEP